MRENEGHVGHQSSAASGSGDVGVPNICITKLWPFDRNNCCGKPLDFGVFDWKHDEKWVDGMLFLPNSQEPTWRDR